MPSSDRPPRIFIAGHRGMVGSAIARRLSESGHHEILTRNRDELDLHVMKLDRDTWAGHTSPMLSHINIGTGIDCTIRELAETVARVTGFSGRLEFDSSKPDGTPRKLLDVTRINSLRWKSAIRLERGLQETYTWFLNNQARFRS